MSLVETLNGISVGDEVVFTVKDYACYGEIFTITKIEVDAGSAYCVPNKEKK